MEERSLARKIGRALYEAVVLGFVLLYVMVSYPFVRRGTYFGFDRSGRFRFNRLYTHEEVWAMRPQ